MTTKSNTILITYATNFGSTQEVAEAIAKIILDDGHDVELLPMSQVENLDGYRAILLGSAVNYAKWLPEALEFVQTNQEALNRVPVALFTVHIQNIGGDAQSCQNRHAYLDDVRPLLNPIAEGYFAGKFDRRGAKLLLPKWLSYFIPPIDLRKWKKVHTWAHELSPQLALQLVD